MGFVSSSPDTLSLPGGGVIMDHLVPNRRRDLFARIICTGIRNRLNNITNGSLLLCGGWINVGSAGLQDVGSYT